MNFRNAFDQKTVNESLSLWVFQYFINRKAKENLQYNLKTSRWMLIEHEEDADLVSTYPEAVNYLLSTVSTDEVTA